MPPVRPRPAAAHRHGAAPRPAVRQGGDRCPGALHLHEANDGHVARIRVPGGRLTAAQLRAIVCAAVDLGDGNLHLTSRGNVQLRGLDPGAGQPLADRLFQAGLLPSVERDRVRNVVASPTTGLDGPGPRGFERIVEDLDRLLCETPGLQDLSGRFLIGVDDGRGDVAALGPDLAAVSEAGGCFRLWVVGRPTALTCPADQAAGMLVETAERFLVLARETGAWRVLELSDAPSLVALAPPATEIEQRPRTVPPLGAVVRDKVVSGVHVLPRLGSATAPQWSVVADVAEGASGLERPVRLTPWRTVVVGRLPARESAAALVTLRDSGFETAASSPWLRVSACIGRPGCASALSDVRADADATARAQGLPTTAGELAAYPVHFSGCGRRCGRPAGPHQSVVAISEGTYETTTEES